MSTSRSAAGRMGAWLPVITGAMVLVGAGMLWLQQSSGLAAAGRRIFALEMQRQELVEERSSLLVRYTAATDPQRLEERAREMGFGPVEPAVRLPVYQPETSDGPDSPWSMDGPIRLYHGFGSAIQEHPVGDPEASHLWDRAKVSPPGDLVAATDGGAP